MAIFGIGTDIVEVARIAASLAKSQGLVKRVLTANEQQDYHQSSQPAAFLAKRFAAKEACAKAFGTGIGEHLSFQDFEVTHDAKGRPLLHWLAPAQQLATQLDVGHAHLSISDERDYAIAYVVLEQA